VYVERDATRFLDRERRDVLVDGETEKLRKAVK